MPLPAAVVFDFDGVLVDSERLHWETMAQAMAGTAPAPDWSFYCDHLMGLDDRGAFAMLFERGGLPADPAVIRERIQLKARLFADLAADGRVPALPGAVELVRACAAAGPVALCSGALLSDIAPILKALDIQDCFAVRVTADDVEHSKPNPASYRLCVAQLARRFPDRSIEPSGCIAIEDTPEGIAAALGAGLQAIGVATHQPAQALLAAGASQAVESLLELSPDCLAH